VNIEGNPNVVVVGTDFTFKIFSGKLLDVAPKSLLQYRPKNLRGSKN
jgi:hypothetical protein